MPSVIFIGVRWEVTQLLSVNYYSINLAKVFACSDCSTPQDEDLPTTTATLLRLLSSISALLTSIQPPSVKLSYCLLVLEALQECRSLSKQPF